jgi:hypothetical protein
VKCNTPSLAIVLRVRRLESQSFSRPHIQLTSHLIAIGLGNRAHTHALGEVLPQESVEVFVGASLPRMVGRGEIAFDGVNHFNDPVVVELRSVVEGDGLEPAAVLRDGHHSGFVGLGHAAARELLDNGKAGLALHQGEHAMVLVCTNDCVALPVANAPPSLDLFGPLADVALVRLNPSVIDTAVALAAELGDDPGVLPQRAALCFVSQDLAVDRAVADVQLTSQLQGGSDLLGAPFLAQESADVQPVIRLEQGPATTSLAPALRVLLRPRWAVGAVIPRGISRDLAADGRDTSPQLLRNGSHTRATTHSRGNEVSFFSGELVIRQSCNPCLAGKRKQQYHRSPTFKNRCCTSDVNPRSLTGRSRGRQRLSRRFGNAKRGAT